MVEMITGAGSHGWPLEALTMARSKGGDEMWWVAFLLCSEKGELG